MPSELDMVFLRKSREFLEEHAMRSPKQPFFLLHSMSAVHLPSFASKQFRGSTKACPHGDFIHELDAIVGELMKTLELLGMADNTVVMFTSDNGPETTTVVHMRADYGHDGARPWRGMKRDQWEGGHRVPLIVRWPGIVSSSSRSDQTVCLTDVMATCAAITGAELPPNSAQDSANILPVLLGKQGAGQVRAYTLHQTISLAMAIRKGPGSTSTTAAPASTTTTRPNSSRTPCPTRPPKLPASSTTSKPTPARGRISTSSARRS